MKWRICNINEITETERCCAYLSMPQSKRERVDRMKKAEARARSICAHYIMTLLLKEEFDIASPVIAAKENGAPYVKGHDIHISIAHSDCYVACAASHRPIGIDIEKMRTVDPRLIDRVCVDAEREYIQGGDITARFFEVWTGKEAYFKMLGTGITDLRSVNILTLDRKAWVTNGYFVQIVFKC